MASKGWRDMDEIPQGNGEKAARPDDLVNIAKFKSGKWVTIRLLPGVMTQAVYWVETKKKDGNKARFPVPVPGFDSRAGSQDSEVYDPWGEAAEKLNVYAEDREKSKVVIQFSKSFWMNAIIRTEQENEPAKNPKHTKQERETGFKDKDSDSWTPVQVVRLPKSFLDRVNGLKTMNVKRNKKTGSTESYSVSHAKYGCDIMVKYNPEASPASQWEVQKGDRTPLTEEEQAYLIWDLDLLANPVVTEEESRKEFKSWCTRNKIKLDGDEDEDDAPKKSKKSKKVEEDDDEFDDPKPKKGKKSKKDEDDEDDDDFDDPKPKKKSKKSRDEDDEDDDDFDDPKPSKKSKKSRDEDEDEDDEEDDPKPSKKSKKSKKDDDDEDFDEDEDDDPKPSKKSKKARDEDEDDDFDDEDDEPKSKKKSKKSRDEDEDDDEEDDHKPKKKAKKSRDEDEDEDEEDDPKPSKKSKSKKRKDDDDDDGWDDDDE